MKELLDFLAKIEDWANSGSSKSVDEISTGLAHGYRALIRAGKGADGVALASLKQATLKSPVRLQGDPTIRSHYGNTPLSVTGETASSIKSFRISKDKWEIGSESTKGDAVLKSNAKTTHSGIPFGGDTPKGIRDPLQVSDKQLDYIEEELVKAIDRVIR